MEEEEYMKDYMEKSKDWDNFLNGNFEEVKNPAGVIQSVFSIQESMEKYFGFRNNSHNDLDVKCALQFATHEAELEMMEKIRAIMSLYERMEETGDPLGKSLGPTFFLKMNEDARLLVQRMEGWNRPQKILESIKLKVLPIFMHEDGMRLKIQDLRNQNTTQQVRLMRSAYSPDDPILHNNSERPISLRNLLDIINEDRRYAYGNEDVRIESLLKDMKELQRGNLQTELEKAIDESIRSAFDFEIVTKDKEKSKDAPPSLFEEIINDNIRSAFDLDIVMEIKDEVESMENPPKWAKELPPAAVLAAFEAQRCVSDKDLEKLNDPENQKAFIQALKNATYRNGGHAGRESSYAIAEFFYPDCSRDLADTYVFGVYCTSTASHPHEIDTSLQTDEQLRKEVDRLAKMKSSRIIPKKEAFTIPETYKILERNGFTLAKTTANVNGAKMIAKQSLTEYIPKLYNKDICMAISREKGEEYVGVIKFNTQKNSYEVQKAFGTKAGIEKMNGQLEELNERILENKRGSKAASVKER